MLLPIIGLSVTAGNLGMTIWARKRNITMKWYDLVIVSVVLITLPISLTSTISFITEYFPFYYGMSTLLIFHVMSVTIPLIFGIWYFFERFVRSGEEEGDSGPLSIVP